MGPGYAYCMSYPRWNVGSGAGWRAGALGLVAFALLLRLIYSGQVELLPEEAYYWNYSRHLDFGYLDHPPMVGWLIGAGTAAFGDTEFGVRIGALCCGVIASFFMYRLTRNLFGEPSGLAAVVLMQTLPFFFLAGMLMTPDAPLTAAWAAALYFLERALIAGRGEAWWGAGLCLGYRPAVEVHDWPVGRIDVHLHAARFALARVVTALGTVWRGVARLGGLFPGDHLECPP